MHWSHHSLVLSCRRVLNNAMDSFEIGLKNLCGTNKQMQDSRFVHDDVIKWKHFPRYWPVRGIHRSPVNSPHKGQWRGALMFSLICAWINGWVNNREAGDLRPIAPIMTSPSCLGARRHCSWSWMDIAMLTIPYQWFFDLLILLWYELSLFRKMAVPDDILCMWQHSVLYNDFLHSVHSTNEA